MKNLIRLLVLAVLGYVVITKLPESMRPWTHLSAGVRWRMAPEDVRARTLASVEEHDGQLVRWRRGSEITVWVEKSLVSDGRDLGETAVRAAFREWEGVVPVNVVYVGSEEEADVRVLWIDRYDQALIGLTEIRYGEQGGITGGDVEIAMRSASGVTLTRGQMQAAARHEIGHLLGFAHTEDRTSIMYPYLTEQSAISGRDREAARFHYSLPIGRFRLKG
jgi:hypothetical protein